MLLVSEIREEIRAKGKSQILREAKSDRFLKWQATSYKINQKEESQD